jgi:hypothetical protein
MTQIAADDEIEGRVRSCADQLNACIAQLPDGQTPAALMSYRAAGSLAVKWDNSDSPPWSGEWSNKDN